jgi:hypothetical protein
MGGNGMGGMPGGGGGGTGIGIGAGAGAAPAVGTMTGFLQRGQRPILPANSSRTVMD